MVPLLSKTKPPSGDQVFKTHTCYKRHLTPKPQQHPLIVQRDDFRYDNSFVPIKHFWSCSPPPLPFPLLSPLLEALSLLSSSPLLLFCVFPLLPLSTPLPAPFLFFFLLLPFSPLFLIYNLHMGEMLAKGSSGSGPVLSTRLSPVPSISAQMARLVLTLHSQQLQIQTTEPLFLLKFSPRPYG